MKIIMRVVFLVVLLSITLVDSQPCQSDEHYERSLLRYRDELQYYSGCGRRGQPSIDKAHAILVEAYNMLPAQDRKYLNPPPRKIEAHENDDGHNGMLSGLGVLVQLLHERDKKREL